MSIREDIGEDFGDIGVPKRLKVSITWTIVFLILLNWMLVCELPMSKYVFLTFDRHPRHRGRKGKNFSQ
jgi:hypothetical protein